MTMITCCKSSTYVKLKRNLRRNTLLAGTTLVACNTVTGDVLAGVSTAIGVAASCAYLNLLIYHVDHIENSDSIQKHIAIPVGVAIFESWWNHNFPDYTLNQGDTLIGFLSYQFALMTILYETISEMLTRPTSSSFEQPSSPLEQTHTCTDTPDQPDPVDLADPAHHADHEQEPPEKEPPNDSQQLLRPSTTIHTSESHYSSSKIPPEFLS